MNHRTTVIVLSALVAGVLCAVIICYPVFANVGKLFGIIGVLLAIPVATVVSLAYHERFLPWSLERRRARAAAEKAEAYGADGIVEETENE